MALRYNFGYYCSIRHRNSSSDDILFIDHFSVYRHIACRIIDIKLLSLSSDNSFYYKLIKIFTMSYNNDIAVFRNIVKARNKKSVLIMQSFLH